MGFTSATDGIYQRRCVPGENIVAWEEIMKEINLRRFIVISLTRVRKQLRMGIPKEKQINVQLQTK